MPTEHAEVAQALANYFRGAQAPGVVSAYLFGSHGSHREHRQSDVDVGILLDWSVHPTREGRFEQRLLLSGRLAGIVGTNDVDVVILNDAPPQLGRAIVTTGRRVFCSDAEADHVFLRTALLRAADIEPFLRRARRAKLAAIAR